MTQSTSEVGSPQLPVQSDRARQSSAVYLPAYWYVICESRELRRRPIKRTFMGLPLVLFRDGEGRAAALVDRCPHRNVPLSLGSVVEGRLQCAYHGWRFDADGVCVKVPGLCGVQESRARDALSHAAVEQDGFVWIWGQAGESPESQPPPTRTSREAGYTTVRRSVDFAATLHATVENALDVPHTAFLHKGLFRGRKEPLEIRAVVTRTPQSVQVEFLGEPRPPGLVARILSPSGGVMTHFDRFLMPSVAEVEYSLGEENHIVVTSYCCPVDRNHTRVFATVSFRLRLPHWLVKPLVLPLAMRIFKQDAWILAAQTESIERFGGERYCSTEIDLIGGQVWRLLRRAEQGRLPEPDPDWRKEVKLLV
ncbi:MAG: aromatic ring-hydroxylating dioxygenase subunit alpha [Myxococcota bacterium]|nr:aromatic ring-hydroxylating dioxygenase subunit alpha [Myxococcota bacterium]